MMKINKRLVAVFLMVLMIFTYIKVDVLAVSTPTMSVSTNGTQVTFYCNDIGADCYTWYISRKNSYGNYELIYDGDYYPVFGTSSTHTLEPGEYRANMRAWSSGQPSGYSNVVYFSISNQEQGVATAPVLSYRIDGNTVRIFWPDNGADYYTIYIAKKDYLGLYNLVIDGDSTPVYTTESIHYLEAGRYCVNARGWKNGSPSATFSERIYFDVVDVASNKLEEPETVPVSEPETTPLTESESTCAPNTETGNLGNLSTETLPWPNTIPEKPTEKTEDYNDHIHDNLMADISIKYEKKDNENHIIKRSWGYLPCSECGYVKERRSSEQPESHDFDEKNKCRKCGYQEWQDELKELYKRENKIYWNNRYKKYGTEEEILAANYSYTEYPCNCKDHTHSILPYDAICTCNTYSDKSQCMGFAALNYNRIWGHDPDFKQEQQLTNLTLLKPGDIVKFPYTNDNTQYRYHYVLVLGIDSSSKTITVLDCNYGENCVIKYGRTFTLEKMNEYGSPTYIEGK